MQSTRNQCAAHRLEFTRRRTNAMDIALRRVETLRPNCGLDRRAFDDAQAPSAVALVHAEDAAEAASTRAYELRKHVPCLRKVSD